MLGAQLVRMLKELNNKFLLASVFVTGTAVLIIEIIAIRILSSHYGNTIYTTSSVIGIVLAALSLGYYFGGVISDKYPDRRIFYSIIFVSGFLVIFMHILAKTLLPLLSILFSIVQGPLIFSILLFFMPAFFLGTLSPFAIKLYHLDRAETDTVGKHSGQVFFWSTVGSIIGSLLSGFWLIPHFGINAIVMGTGISLGLWGLFGFLIFKLISKKIIIAIILIFVSQILLLILYLPKKQSNVLYEKDGFYERIKISDGLWQGNPTRFLFQDISYSAAMYLNSSELVYQYTKYYELYKLLVPQAKNAFIIGGGAYSIPKALLKDLPDIKIDVTEIEPELFKLAKKYFNLQDTTRLANYTEDGRRFLNKSPKKYDIIISDVYYSFFQIPIHFTTKEFFSLAKNRLLDNGVFIGNFVGNIDAESPSFTLSEIRTFKDIFPNSYFFAVDSPESKKAQNIIFLGINGNKKIDFNNSKILKNPDSIINDLAHKNIDLSKFNFSYYKELTDDFSPIEYLVSRDINQQYNTW